MYNPGEPGECWDLGVHYSKNLYLYNPSVRAQTVTGSGRGEVPCPIDWFVFLECNFNVKGVSVKIKGILGCGGFDLTVTNTEWRG